MCLHQQVSKKMTIEEVIHNCFLFLLAGEWLALNISVNTGIKKLDYI